MTDLVVDRIDKSDLEISQQGDGKAEVFFEGIEMTGSSYEQKPDLNLFHIKPGYKAENSTHRVDIIGLTLETYGLLSEVISNIGSVPEAMDAIAIIVDNKAKVLAILKEIARET